MLPAKERWALFDFCETLVNFQTADAFVDFVCSHSPRLFTSYIGLALRILNKMKVFSLLDRICGNELYLLKRCKLWLLKGYTQKEIENCSNLYYETLIKPNFIQPMVERLSNLKHNGYRILIVSGGYSLYIKHFANQFGVDGVVANEIRFKNGICCGSLDGINCMNNNKPILLNSYFQTRPAYSIAYSDSITDLPFLRWADKGVVVSKKTHQTWSEINGFSEIVWS